MANQPNKPPNKPLSLAEWQVLVRRCQGKTNKEIATEFTKSENTVKSQVSNALEKMGYRDLLENSGDEVEWSQVGDDVCRRLNEEKWWRPAGATDDPPSLDETKTEKPPPKKPGDEVGTKPDPIIVRGRPSLPWIAGGLALAAVLGFVGLVLGRGQAQPESVAPTIGPTATARIERIRETFVVPQTEIVRETVPVQVTVVVPQTVEVTSTPSPQEPTATPEAQATDAVASAPTAAPPAPAPTIEVTPLALPFEDNFNVQLDPRWRVLTGQPFIENEQLTGLGSILELELGDSTLRDFTLSFDTDRIQTDEGIEITMGEQIRLHLVHVGGSWVKALWEKPTSSGGDWEAIASKNDIGWVTGSYRLKVSGDRFTLFYNGSPVFETLQPEVTTRGPIRLTMAVNNKEFSLDDFKLTAP
jgi:hypothetical protein